MMRWTPTDPTNARDDAGSADGDALAPTTGRVMEDSMMRYLLDAVAATVAGLGARSVVVAVTMALIVATLLLGLTADEATAMVRWCPQC